MKRPTPLRRGFDGAPQLLLGAAEFLALLGDLGLRPVALRRFDRAIWLAIPCALSMPPPRKPGASR